MDPVRQEDGLGCAVASVAFILKITYAEAIRLFDDGNLRVKEQANFYCPEIVEVLKANGLNYRWQKVDTGQKQELKNLSIVFVGKSKKLPLGHFLCRYKNQWMDPWINVPNTPTEAGFRTSLPGKATYLVTSVF